MNRTAHDLSLREAADLLGIHYMTAYRHVRTGRLRAELVAGRWRVRRQDLHLSPEGQQPTAAARRLGQQAAARLARRLVAGDEPGSWRVLDDALAGGRTPVAAHLELLAPAMRTIGEGWASGALAVADEHRATAVALRLVGRLGPRFARRGPRRGAVVLAGVDGDPHALPVAMAADVVRAAGWTVVDLGASAPPDEVARAAAGADRLVAVGLSATTSGHDDAVGRTVAAVRRELRGVPVLLGGGAVDGALAVAVGADGWAATADGLVGRLEALSGP